VLNNKLFITGGYSDRAEAEGEVYCPIIADNSSTGLSMISK